MAKHLIASNLTIKSITTNDERSRLSDGEGLYLLLFVKGGSHSWRFDYTIEGRRKTLSFGTYPATTLSLARKKAEEAREQVRSGIDPSDVRKAAKKVIQHRRAAERLAAEGVPPPNSFEAIAREWYEKNARSWAASHSEKIIGRLEHDVFPWIGQRPVTSIRPADVLELLRRVEARGALETTHRIQQNCGQVFRYAVATGRSEIDPSRDLRGALAPWKPQHYPTLTDPREIGRLLRDIDSYEGTFATRCAMQLAPMLFVRPGELRRAEWDEIDLDNAEWRIPAGKMKSRVLHIVPLAEQSVRILANLKPLGSRSPWVFPGVRTNGEPMSENTVNAALRRLGYDRATLTAHGFRGMASTLLHEQGWPSDVIERQLSHAERNSVKAAYNHAEHLPARRKMMQAWADYLDKLRKGADVVRHAPAKPRRDK
jgi:integrase